MLRANMLAKPALAPPRTSKGISMRSLKRELPSIKPGDQIIARVL